MQDEKIEVCNDCGRRIEWDEERKDYRHLVEPERGCFLIAAEPPLTVPDLVEVLEEGVAAGVVPAPSRSRFDSRAVDELERQAWALCEAMPEALPDQVADALREEWRKAEEFTEAELDEARRLAFEAIVNG